MDPNKVPFLYNFSSILVPTPLDWPEWIRVTGPQPSLLMKCALIFLLYGRLLVLGRCRRQRQEMDPTSGIAEVHRDRPGCEQEDRLRRFWIHRGLRPEVHDKMRD